MTQPVCITFAGVPGSGKTPIAHHLSWNLGLPILNNDAMRTQTHEDTGEIVLDMDHYHRLRDAALKQILGARTSFIYDASVDRSWPDFKPRLEAAGYRWLVISLDLEAAFLDVLAAAKEYHRDHYMTTWLDEHRNFTDQYGTEVGCVITRETYGQRTERALAAATAFLGR